MRRVAPRPLARALEDTVRHVEPATLLGRVQGVWPAAVGSGLAAAARPTGEREGVVTVGCESAVWAQELELLGPDLLASVNGLLGPGEGDRVTRLRFVIGSAANQS